LVQFKRNEFWLISKPDVATPPAFDAFPGANNTFAFWNAVIASGVDGIFAPSATAITLFLISICASSPFNSFCVAHGNAISHLTDQGLPSWNVADLYLSAYSLIRPRFTFLSSIMNA